MAYDGHVWSRAQREDFRALASAAGADITFIYLDIPEAVARERWKANRQTAQRHDIPDDLFTQAVELMEPPTRRKREAVQWRGASGDVGSCFALT